jgi:hypothetical protein
MMRNLNSMQGSGANSLFLAALLVLSAGVSALASDAILPNPVFTSGAVLTADLSVICQPGYSKSVRHTSGRLKHEIYAEYGLSQKDGNYEIDHLIPLGIGGADVRQNLWPESRDTQPWNANVKDQLENYLHGEICAGRIPATEAQQEIAKDWVTAYRKYFRVPK